MAPPKQHKMGNVLQDGAVVRIDGLSGVTRQRWEGWDLAWLHTIGLIDAVQRTLMVAPLDISCQRHISPLSIHVFSCGCNAGVLLGAHLQAQTATRHNQHESAVST